MQSSRNDEEPKYLQALQIIIIPDNQAYFCSRNPIKTKKK